MSIDNPDTIDAIGVDKETGEVVLTISDHHDWETFYEEHKLLLEEKLGQYLHFITSGQLIENYPEIWKINKIYPLDLFMLPPTEYATLVKEKYSDYAAAAWSMAIANFIKKGFASGQWDDEAVLIG